MTEIDWKKRWATHGIELANKERCLKGIGTDAVMVVMRYALDELQLNRPAGSWFPDNAPSKGMYTKCDWLEEGIRRKYVFKNGQYRDLGLVGILAEEYHALIEKNHYWKM